MRKALIIHGWESNSQEHWYQEEKSILEKMGYEVLVPDMPHTNLPVEKDWVKVVEDFSPDKESILIGHSLGVPTILRYLEKTDEKVGKVFLVAGFASGLLLNYPNSEYPQAFVRQPFNWNIIEENFYKMFIINQINDELVPTEKGEEIADKTGGKFILVDGTDHFDKMDLDLINKNL